MSAQEDEIKAAARESTQGMTRGDSGCRRPGRRPGGRTASVGAAVELLGRAGHAGGCGPRVRRLSHTPVGPSGVGPADEPAGGGHIDRADRPSTEAVPSERRT